ncbi:MAG: CapA family protein [Clostridiales bacterium]|nr:CapA family protein [Clostridiales bacterium]
MSRIWYKALALIVSISISMLAVSCASHDVTQDTAPAETNEAAVNVDELSEAAGSIATEEGSTAPSEETQPAKDNSEAAGAEVTVSFVGDLTLTQDVNVRNSICFDAVVGSDLDYCFQNCKEVFEKDDLTLANLENAVTDRKTHATKQFVFAMKPDNLEMLTRASIEAVNIANNHTKDYLLEGLEDTRKNLDEHGIIWSDQYYGAVYEVKGVKIGMFGLSNNGNTSQGFALIDQLKEKNCDIIIATCHWGVEARYEETADQRNLGRALIDHGADIVVGGHPHRLQPIEYYNGHYIIYSLSNFCFGGNNKLSDPDSVIIQCKFIMDETGGNCVDYRLKVIPYAQTSTRPGNDFCPKPYEWGSEDYYRCLKRLEWSTEDE